jgi:hypothetical protein
MTGCTAVATLDRILSVPGVQFVNLQVGPRASEGSLPPRLTVCAEIAALAEPPDLLNTVDTSVTHVGGAVGKPARPLVSHI